jgi:hypothetical protein
VNCGVWAVAGRMASANRAAVALRIIEASPKMELLYKYSTQRARVWFDVLRGHLFA